MPGRASLGIRQRWEETCSTCTENLGSPAAPGGRAKNAELAAYRRPGTDGPDFRVATSWAIEIRSTSTSKSVWEVAVRRASS
jgi:hypothetical protein